MGSQEKVESLREQGNVAWSLHNFNDAISYYSQGINIDRKNYILHSNRSAAFFKIGDYESALDDAESSIKLKKDWIKGYMRKAEALQAMGRWLDASKAYEDGLRYDPKSVALREGRRNVFKQMCEPASLPKDFKKSNLNLKKDSPFARSDIEKLLKKDPRTREFLKDPVYVCLLDRMKKNPTDIGTVMSDQRLLTTLQVLINLLTTQENKIKEDKHERVIKVTKPEKSYESHKLMEAGDYELSISRDNSSTEVVENDTLDFSFSEELFTKLHFSDELSNILTPTGSESQEGSKNLKQQESSESVKEEILTDQPTNSSTTVSSETSEHGLYSYNPEREEKFKIDKAKEEKHAGNEAYRRKDFDQALIHYKNGIKLTPHDMAFYSNTAAVYFEKKEYEKCITECEIAIQVGMSTEANEELIAKAYLRIANSHRKMENVHAAKLYCEKSLRVKPLNNAKSLMKTVEKEIKELELEAYKNPKLAEAAAERGNELFLKNEFRQALEEYGEAIKRDPKEVMYYNNRAVCYGKLREYDKALADCEKACQLDPKMIKSWITKGHLLLDIRNHNEAIDAFDEALKIDRHNSEALKGFYLCLNDDNPEGTKMSAISREDIKSIIFDPKMMVTMSEMSLNPASIRKHMKDPEIAKKVLKLQSAGLVDFKGE